MCTPRDQHERRATLAAEVRTAVGESKGRDKEGYTREAYVTEMLRSAAAADAQTRAAALIAVINSLPNGGGVYSTTGRCRMRLLQRRIP